MSKPLLADDAPHTLLLDLASTPPWTPGRMSAGEA
jgi:hypothetical protein